MPMLLLKMADTHFSPVLLNNKKYTHTAMIVNVFWLPGTVIYTSIDRSI